MSFCCPISTGSNGFISDEPDRQVPDWRELVELHQESRHPDSRVRAVAEQFPLVLKVVRTDR
jgi:hypothetical protein